MIKNEAIDTIETELTEQGIDSRDMAEGILAGLMVGYGMDETAFLAIHGNRLAHLTRLTLKAAGREVKPQPGEMPKGL